MAAGFEKGKVGERVGNGLDGVGWSSNRKILVFLLDFERQDETLIPIMDLFDKRVGNELG